MARTHLRKPSKAELADKVSRLERELGAMQSHFWAAERGAEPFVLEVSVAPQQLLVGESTLFRFTAYNLTAPHGGTVVMRDMNERYSLTPEYLDDLCSRLLTDVNWELRYAARKMLAERERLLSRPA